MSLLHRRDERLGAMLLSELRHVLWLRLAYDQQPLPFGLDMAALWRALSALIEDCASAGFAVEASGLLREARERRDALERARKNADAA